MLIAGIYYPKIAIGFGGAFIFGRIVFHAGYSFKGPKGRTAGFMIQILSSFVLMVFAFISPIRLALATK